MANPPPPSLAPPAPPPGSAGKPPSELQRILTSLQSHAGLMGTLNRMTSPSDPSSMADAAAAVQQSGAPPPLAVPAYDGAPSYGPPAPTMPSMHGMPDMHNMHGMHETHDMHGMPEMHGMHGMHGMHHMHHMHDMHSMHGMHNGMHPMHPAQGQPPGMMVMGYPPYHGMPSASAADASATASMAAAASAAPTAPTRASASRMDLAAQLDQVAQQLQSQSQSQSPSPSPSADPPLAAGEPPRLDALTLVHALQLQASGRLTPLMAALRRVQEPHETRMWTQREALLQSHERKRKQQFASELLQMRAPASASAAPTASDAAARRLETQLAFELLLFDRQVVSVMADCVPQQQRLLEAAGFRHVVATSDPDAKAYQHRLVRLLLDLESESHQAVAPTIAAQGGAGLAQPADP
ncbi:hypothetical protein CXG81DRAFT_25181 [Caulochytrium protostelioides]|uniref:Uncharacterized protein n=1 Tax=Caulochytrium protostelioides TaxID=1555241 RepID=A0A4P9XAP0_9FUNG|nr:hypothetical protein CXG81DRAFT_25181 [Caulochytrium protostelioides]|eukprot:RKP02161.1 hypothetical protein CXG81DRAFT_25181 [Caulochytrium protostelioides]